MLGEEEKHKYGDRHEKRMESSDDMRTIPFL